MRDLKLPRQALVMAFTLAALAFGNWPSSWAQSGSTEVPQAAANTDDTTGDASTPPPTTTQSASESSDRPVSRNASNASPVPARNENGAATPEKEFKPSEEIVEDQAVSFPVDI